MATQVDESASSPQLVAHAFVAQYYNVLSESPESVFKFYHDNSFMTRPESDGRMSTVSTHNDINKMILSLEYTNDVVQILTVDSQASFGDGVIVLVTGLITVKDIRRKFTQLFFLAPQENGYFVLNDVLRYGDDEESVAIKVSDADDIVPAAYGATVPGSDIVPAPVSNQPVRDLVASPSDDDNQAKESSRPLENGVIPSVEKELVTDSVAGAVSVDTVENDVHLASEAAASNIQEDAPKKTYASVVNALNFNKEPFQQKVAPSKPVQQPRPPPPRVVSPRPTGNNGPEKKNNNATVKGYSIFVANLPMDATVEQLIETFEKFGPIKPNGVQVRSYKQEKNCFGFVEFESADSMQQAIQAASVPIGGRQAHIEEKKANNDGGKYPPRKGGLRGDNFRGRGRGYGKSESENQVGFSSHPRGTAGRNGEANQKVHENGGRAARQGVQGGKS